MSELLTRKQSNNLSRMLPQVSRDRSDSEDSSSGEEGESDQEGCEVYGVTSAVNLSHHEVSG